LIRKDILTSVNPVGFRGPFFPYCPVNWTKT
jgi:hypothetical protein